MKPSELGKQDFENRLAGAFIDETGMINLGWNKIHVSSPFGQDLLKKNPNIPDRRNHQTEDK